jgi:hypothetical protein
MIERRRVLEAFVMHMLAGPLLPVEDSIPLEDITGEPYRT